MKILVIDDDWITLAMVESLLLDQDHDVVTAQDGAAGLEAFEKETPDLVISDIEMPKMTGLELLAQVRERNAHVHFIINTAHGSEHYALAALRAGATNYLKKPVDPNELIALVEKYSTLVFDRNKSSRILGYIQTSEFTMQFGNEQETLYPLCEYLVSQVAHRLSAEERFGLHLGLYEIVVNAIEHGNLGITYEEKSKAMEAPSGLAGLVAQRKNEPNLARRKVTLLFKLAAEGCEWTIQDEGTGFDWQSRAQVITPELLTDTHGRGILMTRLQFDALEYIGNGSTVRLVKRFTVPAA